MAEGFAQSQLRRGACDAVALGRRPFRHHRRIEGNRCPTKIFLPNGAAREPGTREFYERIGFNERQIEIVATALPKREYYVASPAGRRIFDMALGPVALSFVGASGKEDLAQIRVLHSQHGADWPLNWLQHRGIAHAASLFPAA